MTPLTDAESDEALILATTTYLTFSRACEIVVECRDFPMTAAQVHECGVSVSLMKLVSRQMVSAGDA